MTIGADAPVVMRSAATRWLLAATVALTAAIGILLFSGGDVLTAYARASQAARLPGNRTLPGEELLVRLDESGNARQARAVALETLRASPLSPRALAWLAAEETRQGNTARGAALRSVAGRTGWHDEWTQRRLYNTALHAGDAASAMHHAEALLRQTYARDELYTQFVRGTGVPEFRAGLVTAIARSPHWPRDFLVQRAGSLDDAALLELATARANANGGLDRQFASPLLARLVSLGRWETAHAIWRLVPGNADQDSRRLEWPDELAWETPTPFDWNLPARLRIERDNGARLVAESVMPGEAARRLVVLPAGDYRLGPAAEGWLWSAGCAGDAVVPNRPLDADARFTVAPDCPAVALVLAPANTGTAAALDELSLESLP